MCTCVIILGTFICNPLRNNLGPVHTYLDSFESTTFSFQIRLPSTRIRRIRQRIRIFLNPLSRVEKNKSAANPITCLRVNPDIFQSDDVPNSSPISYRTINQYGVRRAFAATIARFMVHALNTLYCIGEMGTTVNLNTIG